MENNLMVAGFGGQGVMLMGKMLSDVICEHTMLDVSFFPSYGAQQRGGTANCYVVSSDDEVGSPKPGVLDQLVAFNAPSYHAFVGSVAPGGLLIVNSSLITEDIARTDLRVVRAPVTQMAMDLGNLKVLNVLMLGVYVGYTQSLEPDWVLATLRKKLGKKPELMALNETAFAQGLALGQSQR